ncbi:hypothetical protein [Aeromonas dhakensis]|uniref:Uncharacterized protein n=1 Tax=Aeromonas dhakensis TaxID=196024 RepID=K1JK52_9GAMM|nr:hypothetical protein [Aeromonas dhakensis]EKB28267.1 hypothetical protein HMPREF1171_01501 [Aeromonas dhakensis]
MFNPFSMLSFFYTVAKDSPDPVNVQYEPPSPNLLPSELHKKTKTDGFFTAQLWIENLSNRVLDDVRINLTAPISYDPIVRTSKSHGNIEYRYASQTMELVVDKIDPRESVRITFFPAVDRVDDFNKPQILVEGKELSKLMETLGFYKKYPSYARAYVASIFAATFGVVAAIGSVGFAGYVILQDNEYLFPNSDAVLMRQASERMKGYGCPQRVEAVTNDLKWQVMSTFGYPATILKMNAVDSEEELWKKEKIVFIDCGS